MLVLSFLGTLIQWFSKCGSGPAVSASPGNLLEMQILGLYPRPTKSEFLGVGPSSLCFNRLLPGPSYNQRHSLPEVVIAGDRHTMVVGPLFMV